LLERARASVTLREQRCASVPPSGYPPELPISPRALEIVEAIRKHQVLVIAGETGSGKTTQIPKMCLEAGLGIEAAIGCTQPRRVAALSISRRVAEELNVVWGGAVGCKIRFDDRSSPQTLIKFMTDGILLAETKGDPLLSEYNALIIDEAHERSLNIDFLLGYLKGLLGRRPELKLIITSATINTRAFSEAFNQAPILEVSGRMFPVQTLYAPLEQASDDEEELSYVDAAAAAVLRVLNEPGNGDVLVFMPTERDIRETVDALRNRAGDHVELFPLFGRLSSGDQQRVFAPSHRRKVVVATNIAETSLTIPNIRFVIDAGLARVSRYNPRTRTKRLPIEPISRSSANQRKGRSGRVREGVCIRLYSEPDLAERPEHTQPEIQRANLAEVILRMKAFRLGEIETFPFVDPPSSAAIQGGYGLLRELGAVDAQRELTPLGADLARLPIDPAIGRMLLEAHRYHATRELLIIASGLSIQDPRERPAEQKDTARAVHQRFADPRSDFLTLLNVWNAVHELWESLGTQNQRRKFCKANFLSYLRMREWQDLHAQLEEALGDIRSLPLAESNAEYDAIHRSILAGLLGHVAIRSSRNTYKAAGGRELRVFPGSALHEGAKPPLPKSRRQTGAPPVESTSQPEWIVAGEIVETSQLFARTIAGIQPEWIVELAPHLCSVTYENPAWSVSAGRVLADEKTAFNGMVVRTRKAAYGNVNPAEATEVFIRSALVEDSLFPEDEPEHHKKIRVLTSEDPGRLNYPFLEHNRKLRERIATWQTRMRRHDLKDVDQSLFEFYRRHIHHVSSLDELNRLLSQKRDRSFLCASEEDLVAGHDLQFDAEAFPDQVPLAGHAIPLEYAYRPGEPVDGVTLKVPAHLVGSLSQAGVEWAVPGLREAQAAELLKALPKSLRRQLMPLAPKAAEIARELRLDSGSLAEDLTRFVRRRYSVQVPVSAWLPSALPAHLRPRVEVLANRAPVVAGRELNELRSHLVALEKKAAVQADDAKEWKAVAGKWERFELTGWNFGELPEKITVAEKPPVHAWPALAFEEGQVNLRLFRAPDVAARANGDGIRHLAQVCLQRDLGWLQKDLRALNELEPLLTGFASAAELQASAFLHLRNYILPLPESPIRRADEFAAYIERARSLLPGLAQQLVNKLKEIFVLRQEILRRCAPASAPARVGVIKSLGDLRAPGGTALASASPTRPQGDVPAAVRAEVNGLIPASFPAAVTFDKLGDFPRYLKALLTRAERAKLNPVKDKERACLLQPYREALAQLSATGSEVDSKRRLGIEEFRWMLEEYKVSVFAQELGTAYPVSPKRLDEKLHELRG
jgi:ATP-dependent helicase HrpA